MKSKTSVYFPFKSFLFFTVSFKTSLSLILKVIPETLDRQLTKKKDFHKGPLATILIKHFWGILCVLPLALGFKWLPSVCKDHEGSYRPESVLSPDRINTVCRLWYCATAFQVISSAEKVGKWYTRYCLIYFITACETITSN